MVGSSWGRAAEFESKAALEDVSDTDIHFSRLTGMSPSDIEHLRAFTVNEGLLIVIRCPKRQARYHHGKIQPKTMATGMLCPGLKSGEDGIVHIPGGGMQVSDYDLMCVYRIVCSGKYEKLFFSGISSEVKRSSLTVEAAYLLRKVNKDLKSRFQHGAQDDYKGDGNPGVRMSKNGSRPDRFAIFNVGTIDYLPNPESAKKFYAKFGLTWPYNDQGLFSG
ncbi:hypothetical protein [Methylorubrum aminovorans]